MAATTRTIPKQVLLAVPVTKGWIYTLWIGHMKLAESNTFTTAAALHKARRIDAPGVPIFEAVGAGMFRRFRWR